MDKLSVIDEVDAALRREFKAHAAPIIELIEAQTHDPFAVLIGTILSARTKDACTAGAVRRLFERGGGKITPALLDALSLEELEKLIFPVGFFHEKARHLKALPAALREKFGGVLPQTVEELCELPGVGRKTANLTVAVGFDLPAICVDVHVHRICNNLGLVKTSTPLETEMALRKILPVKYWKTWNSHLVSFGQTRCLPRGARCEGCPIARHCRCAPGRTVILANGEFPAADSPAGRILATAKRVIACDGAADAFRDQTGREADYVVGDLDSIGRDGLRAVGKAGVVHLPDQETNDLEKAIRFCRGRGWKDLVIVGASGKREDHLLSNVFRAMALGVEMVTAAGRFLPFGRKLKLKVKKGTPISVFATDAQTRMTSKGLEWPLAGVKFANLYCATLNRASAPVVEIAADRASFVFVAEGK